MVAKKEVVVSPNNESLMVEAIIHFQLKHVNIVNLHCWERVDDTLTLFMEYCSGGDIKSNIDRIKGKEALNYFSQLMEGVAYLHSRGVAHRDLKLENLLLTAQKVFKIADLGLADVFLVNGEEVQLSGTVGSRAFMAPEVIQCSGYSGPPVDLWSCGIIFFNLTTKGRPWEQAAPQEDRIYKMWLDKDEELNTLIPWCWLSESCRTVVDILLEPDPQKRLSGGVDMFFSSSNKQEDQQPSSPGEPGKDHHSGGKSRRKTSLKFWTRLCILFSCQSGESSEQSQKDKTSEQSAIEKTPRKTVLKENKKAAKAFKDSKWNTVKVLGAGAFGKVF
ncbi:serine/threonine-protein kinase Chk1-like [Oratosquilla oratoria]|uniref:serine/threonine-protein kinase Chk1-like n=1 Tax=Oratosquilla oratoria TaxID=337810 RepID=UPI003F769A04